jgi:hypothetical protein
MVHKRCPESFKVIAEQIQEKIFRVFLGRAIENCSHNTITHERRPLTGHNFGYQQYFSMGLKAADKFHFLLSETAIKSREIS